MASGSFRSYGVGAIEALRSSRRRFPIAAFGTSRNPSQGRTTGRNDDEQGHYPPTSLGGDSGGFRAALVGAPCPVVVYPEPNFGPGDLPFPCHCNSPFSTNVARGQATA